MVRPKSKAEMIAEDQQQHFRSTIGTLMYLVKLSRPDIANPVKKISKVMNGAAPGHEKELKRLSQSVLQTKGKRLNMNTTEGTWEIEGYSDSDFDGDKDERKA
jgi:hypothetical protein